MNLSEYQTAAHRTSLGATYGEGDIARLIYPTLKLAGEAGEFAEKVGKLIRDKDGRVSEEDRDALRDELGDVLWYVAEVATVLDLDLDAVGRRNIEKLASRAERGVIQGSGDKR
ncbi:MAG: nucleoside triphosphate pyrophosphohydrolase family protein [Gemmatimonadota bacterium]|nr:MAG: nucleoside triphosphate pyrophosphohydrolase family protein [Gemmatimonadota bacterium]